MDGGLLQLIAKDAKDLPLINKPQITHFKKVYRKTGSFSLMDSDVLLDNLAFNKNKLCKIPKIGDLLSKVYLELTIEEFMVKKYNITNYQDTIFIDNNYQTKLAILKKILEIDDLENLQITDDIILKLSPNSLAKNILLALKNKINNTYQLELDYHNNYQIITFLLSCNLKNEDLILADFLLRFIGFQSKQLLTGTNYLENTYQQLYQELILNYYKNIPNNNSIDYQLSDNIINEIINYYYDETLSNELTEFSNISSNPIDFIKDNFEYEINIIKNLISLIFPEDNFRNGSLKNIYILPFFLYLYYDPNNNNNLKYEITDKKLISSKFIKNNIEKIQNNIDIKTPALNKIQLAFEKYKLETENYFNSVNFQKILGKTPFNTLAKLIAITEIWKWQVYDFNNFPDNQIIPGLEILNLSLSSDITEFISSVSYFRNLVNQDDIYNPNNFEKNFTENLNINFERKKPINQHQQTDLNDFYLVVNEVENYFKDVSTFVINNTEASINSNYLNRTAIDLSLILVYIIFTFKNDLMKKNIFKKNVSLSWINFFTETINSKMYSKWFSEFTTRIDTTFVGPDVYLKDTGEVGLRIDDKIPLTILCNNTYLITSKNIKNLIELQTHKFNYIAECNNISNFENNNYQLKTIKNIYNLDLTLVRENNRNYLIVNSNIINIWYHHFTNKYYLINTKKILLSFSFIRNNKIYFEINENISISSNDYLQVIINDNLFVNDLGTNLTINTITTTQTFTENELTYNYFFKIYYNILNEIIDLRIIPKNYIIENNYELSSSYTLPNEISFNTSEIKYFNQLELPNFLSKFDMNREYYSYDTITQNNIGNYGDNKNNLIIDKFFNHSFIHQISYIQKNNTNNQILLYHLPYKINSQIYNNIKITSETYLNDEKLVIQGRFGNRFNLREKYDNNNLRCYSEGLDYFDNSLDLIKLNLLDNEDDQLKQLSNLLLTYYQNKESNYQEIVNAHDFITENFYLEFIDALEKIKNIGPIYQQIIETFFTKNNLDLNSLKSFIGNSFEDNYFWSGQKDITNNFDYLYQFFKTNDINATDVSSPITSWVNYQVFLQDPNEIIPNKFFIPKNIYSNESINFLNNYSKNLVSQIDNINNNFNIITNYPRISLGLLNNQELQHNINKNFSEIIEPNLYEIKTKNNYSISNPIYYQNNLLDFKSDNTFYSETKINDIHNNFSYQVNEVNKKVFPISFYDYAITLNNKVIFLPENFKDSNNNYDILDQDENNLNLTYQEITFEYIIFNSNNSLSSLINVAKNNKIILKNNNDLLPYGKIIPDFTNPYKYYRVKGNIEKLNNKLIFEKNLIENYYQKNNILYLENFNNTTKKINEIYHSNNLKLEFYNLSYTISSQIFSLEILLEVNKFDFIFIDNQWLMFDENIRLNFNDTSGSEFYLFRFISNTNRNDSLYEELITRLYDYSEITFENLLNLSTDLEYLSIKNNQIENNSLNSGDFIVDITNSTLHQVNNFQEIYPQLTLKDENKYLKINQVILEANLSKLSNIVYNFYGYNITLNYLTQYRIYQLPPIYQPNPWEFRPVENSDLYFNNNTLTLATTTENGNWVYQAKETVITFYHLFSFWYFCDSLDLQVGDYIINTNISNNDYLNNPNQYLHYGDIIGKVLGRSGKYYFIFEYSGLINSTPKLVKSYPFIFKPNEKQLASKLYQDNSDNIILEKINLQSVKLNQKKYLVSITNKILTVNSGYDNDLKEVLTFNKNLIYPQQKILLNSQYWNTIKNYQTLELLDNIDDGNYFMEIPEIPILQNLTENNQVLDKKEYLENLQVNQNIQSHVILFNDTLKNTLVYSDNLLIKENNYNYLTFEFNDQSYHEKFLEIFSNESEESEPGFDVIYVNINNLFILKCEYDLITNKLYGFKFSPSEIFLANLNNHLYLINSYYGVNNGLFFNLILSSQVLENKNIKLNNFNSLLYNLQNLDFSGIDFTIYSYQNFYQDLNYKTISKYPIKNIYLNEFINVNLVFSDGIIKENDKFKIRLDSNPLNSLDNQKIYQDLIEMEIIQENVDYFLVSPTEFDLNKNFYQKKNILIEYLKEHINLIEQKVIPTNKYYFHYRIGFYEYVNKKDTQLIRIDDYFKFFDFNSDKNKNTEIILNSNLNYFIDNQSLNILNYSKDISITDYFSSYNISVPEETIYKNNILVEIHSNDIILEDTNNQLDLLVYQEQNKILLDNLVKNELDIETNNLLEYSKENYLMVKVLDEINWEKIINLSNGVGENLPNDNFNNTITYQDDFNNYNDIELTLDLQTKHNNILEIVNIIYQKIPQWIFNQDFINDPDYYLNNFLVDYDLKYVNNKFFNLDDTEYESNYIPTYFKIVNVSGTFYLEYLVQKENFDINFNYKLIERILNENPSQELGLKLTNLINFYDIWEKIKLGIPELYQTNEIYLSGNKINLHLEQIYKKQLIDLYDKQIYQGTINNIDYHTNNIFEYLVNLTNLPNNSELYYLDFKENSLVFNDMEVEYNYPTKNNATLKISNFLPEQSVDLYGKITYQITSHQLIGKKYQVTLPPNSIPSVNFTIEINNQEINYLYDTNLHLITPSLGDYITIKVKTSVSVKNGKYYLTNSNIIPWIDEHTFLNNEIIEIFDNQIITPKPTSNVITLKKVVKIISSTNLNEYTYRVKLDNTFNNTPSYGYQVLPSDLLIDALYIPTSYSLKNNELYLTFSEELNTMKNLVQQFKINYQNKYEVLSTDLSKTILNFGEEKNINMFNKFYLNFSDLNNNELGNYLYQVSINNTNTYFNQKVYYLKNNQITLLGKLVGNNNDGYYLITIEKIHQNNDYVTITTLITLDNNEIIEINNLNYQMKNNILLNDYSLKFEDVINNITFNYNLFQLNLEEELVEETLENQILGKCNNLLSNLKPSRNLEKYQYNIIEETPIYKKDFGYDILESMSVKLKNNEIEKFDNKMFREYMYYFYKPEKQKLVNKMLSNPNKIIIPLPFWFCRSWNNSLPIVIANESDFYLDFTFNKLGNILENTGEILNKPKITGKLVFNTIWLGDEEKSIIGNNKQDYLITTFHKAQKENIYKITQEIDLKLNGAIKDVFFNFYIGNSINQKFTEKEIIDELYNIYINLTDNDRIELINLVDDTSFTNLYENILNRFTNFYQDRYFVGYLILHYLEINPMISTQILIRKLAYYYQDRFKKEKFNTFYPLKNASLVINSYQHIRNKSSLFWSGKNQLNYQNSGELSKYGYSYSLFPLSQQPSGHINHNLVNSSLIVEMNPEYYNKVKNNKEQVNLEIFYRKYRLLRFMGNQAGVLW